MIAVLLAGIVAACAPPPPAPPAESVLFVLVDALRRDHVGVYGRSPSPTPAIDGLAAQGVVFDQATAPSSWTRSSIASMFASRFPTSLGVLGRDDVVRDDVVMLAEALRDRGFRTLGVWTNGNANQAFGFAQGFDVFQYPELEGGYPNDFLVPTAEGVTKKALALIDTVAPGQRFFLFAHYVDVHDPYLPHPELATSPEPAGAFSGSRRDLERLDATAQPQPVDLDRVRFLYRNAVAYTDHWVGALVSGLRARQRDRNLLVVVTADHGEGLWAHGVRGHGGDLYEEMTGVPLILASAARPAGAPVRVSTPTSLVDLAPTIVSAAGLPAVPSFTGTDLAPFAPEPKRPGRASPVYSEVTLDGVDLESIRSGSYKLIRSRGGAHPKPTELFDLAADPGEKDNVIGVRPEQAVRMSLDLAAIGDALRKGAIVAPQAGRLDPQTRDNLRALGYLGGSRAATSKGPPLDAAIDFASARHPARQLLAGFFASESGRRWMGPHAEALLGRSPAHRTWRLVGRHDPSFFSGRPLSILVRVNSAPPTVLAVPNGPFTLAGDLPDDGLPRVHLVVDCSASFVPARQNAKSRDVRELCVTVTSIALR